MLSIEKKRRYPYVIIAIVALVAAVAVGVFVVISNSTSPDSVIVEVEPEEGEAKDGVDVSLKYAGYVTLLSDEKRITLNFTNPSTSKKSLSLELVASIDGEDVILGKSEIIRPGQKIVELKYNLGREIPLGKYKGKYVIHFYNEQGGEEIVKSEIAMNVFVK